MGGAVSTYAIMRRGSHNIQPRLDAIDPNERLDPDAPLSEAYLAGRPIVLAQQRATTAQGPRTVPITISRLRRAIDIERGRASPTFEPSLVDDYPLSGLPEPGTGFMIALAACAIGYLLLRP